MKIGETPKGEKGEGSGSGATERIVPGSGAVEVPMLGKGNYQEWALLMQVALEALELWEAVEKASADRALDRRALSAILRSVPHEMKGCLAIKATAKEAWDSVKSMRGGDDRVKACNVQKLMKEFEVLRFNDGESVAEFAVRVNRLTARLSNLGERLEAPRVVKKVLRVVPKQLRQVAVAVEMLADLDAMSLDELVGRLQIAEDAVVEDDEPVGSVIHNGRLMMSEAQWEARRKQRRGGRRSCVGDREEDDDGTSSTSSGRGRSRYRGKCFDCGEQGHMARDCPKKKKEKAFLAGIDEEPTLL
ncbi:unnamed protein product [Urochloa humidicola]